LAIDYQQKLNDIAEDIFSYADELWVIKDIFDKELFSKVNKKITISSPHYNFRDALFHYNKMYEAAQKSDEEIFNKQYACVAEHLNRGLKDFIIYLCFNYYTNILHKMLDSGDPSINDKTFLILKNIYHAFKNLVVKMRLEGQDVQQLEEYETMWLTNTIKIINQLSSLRQENIQLNNLYTHFANIVAEEITKKIHI